MQTPLLELRTPLLDHLFLVQLPWEILPRPLLLPTVTVPVALEGTLDLVGTTRHSTKLGHLPRVGALDIRWPLTDEEVLYLL